MYVGIEIIQQKFESDTSKYNSRELLLKERRPVATTEECRPTVHEFLAILNYSFTLMSKELPIVPFCDKLQYSR
jgi:hypothetical protein